MKLLDEYLSDTKAESRLKKFNTINKLEKLAHQFPKENEVLDLLFFNIVIPEFIDAIDRNQKSMITYMILRNAVKGMLLSDYLSYYELKEKSKKEF